VIGALDEIRDLKTRAKNRRDGRHYSRGVGYLNDAISIARTELDSTTAGELRAQAASELADCYGLLGGIERRWGLDPEYESERDVHLKASVDAYDAGYVFEQNPEYGWPNSYNMINRLVGRLLLRPDRLATTGAPANDADGVDVRAELGQAADVLHEQLRTSRREDYWALADLALVNLLLDRQDPVSAYSRFNAESPPPFAYKSVLDTLGPLAQLAFAPAPKLREAIRHLENRMPTP